MAKIKNIRETHAQKGAALSTWTWREAPPVVPSVVWNSLEGLLSCRESRARGDILLKAMDRETERQKS